MHVVYATSAKSFFSCFRLLRQNDVTQDSSSSFLSFANPFFFCAITQNEEGRKRRRKEEEQQKKQFAQLPHWLFISPADCTSLKRDETGAKKGTHKLPHFDFFIFRAAAEAARVRKLLPPSWVCGRRLSVSRIFASRKKIMQKMNLEGMTVHVRWRGIEGCVRHEKREGGLVSWNVVGNSCNRHIFLHSQIIVQKCR